MDTKNCVMKKNGSGSMFVAFVIDERIRKYLNGVKSQVFFSDDGREFLPNPQEN